MLSLHLETAALVIVHSLGGGHISQGTTGTATKVNGGGLASLTAD